MAFISWADTAAKIRDAIARNDWTALEVEIPGQHRRRFRSWEEVKDLLEFCEQRAAAEAFKPVGRTIARAGRR
jgi:hypothetical protein